MAQDIDEDLRREDIDARQRRARGTACQCGSDLPGSCPGPEHCPYADLGTTEETEERAAYLDGVRRRARLYAQAAHEHLHNPRG